MFLKRTILSLSLVVCFGQTTLAIPAYPYPKKIQQADGSYITVTIRGDEHGHIVLSEDGLPLCFNSATGNYDYAQLQNGHIVASGVKAENKAARSAKAQAFLKSQNAHSIFNTFEKSVARASGNFNDMRINNFPTQGVQHSLVILAQFSDCPFSTVGNDAKQFYTDMLNKEGFTYSNGAMGSARDFYIASSAGKFLPTFDVIGPITLPKSYAYYGANLSSRDNATRLMEFVKDACMLADPLVDFSQYDHDGDGLVDNVFIYFAGYGEADSGQGNTIWPHAADYRSVCKDAGESNSSLVLDGKQIASYTCTNEINGQTKNAQPTGIGTFVHEFGHVLGLADHYDTAATSLGEAFHPGAFDTMASGSYNNNGNTPPTFSAFERATLGWLEYEDLTSAADTLNVLPNLEDSNKAYRVQVNGTKGNEFFVLENRQQKGWDQYLPGHGMLMWHIDYDKDLWSHNEVNINNAHQHIDIVEADNIRSNLTRTGDTFPGAANVTSWKMTSWGDENILSIDDIEEKDGRINVMLGGLNIKLPTPEITMSEVNDSNAVITWNTEDIAKQYVLNLYQVEGGKKSMVDGYNNRLITDADNINFVGLKPETDYQVTLQAQRGSYSSEVAIRDFQTTAIPFAKLYPTHLKVSDVTTNGCVATWDAVDGADDYEVTLSIQRTSDETQQRGYDFTEQLAGMPTYWETNAGFISNPSGEAAPSLRMNRDGSYLLVRYGDEPMSGIQFWAKASNTANGRILVQIPSDGESQNILEINVDDDLKSGKIYQCGFDRAESLRIYVERSAGTFYIDDVYAACHPLLTISLDAYNKISTQGKNSINFSDLAKEGNFFLLTVRAKKGKEMSVATQMEINLSQLTGIQNPMTSNTENQTSPMYYDLNGRRLVSAPTHGVYIIKQGNKVYKIVK